MNQILLSTNNTTTIDDLGAVVFTHPLSNFVLHDTSLSENEFSLEELKNSSDLQSAIDSNDIVLTDENGTVLTDIGQASVLLEVDQIQSGATGVIYVNTTHTGIENGSINAPFSTVQAALNSASNTVFIEILNKEVFVNQPITLPSTLSKISIQGNGTTIKYSSYNPNVTQNVIEQTNTSYTGVINLKGLKLQNGTNGLFIASASKVVIDECEGLNNGYDNTNFSTILPSSGSRLGYDSTTVDLQNFAANNVQDNTAAFKLSNVTIVEVTGCVMKNNNSGVFLTDCGINGAGYITRNQITENYTGGVVLAADFNDPSSVGTQNIITTINSISYNGSFGAICYGGINNKFSQNDMTKNWNAAFVNYGCANVTLRDSSIYDNNFVDQTSAGQVFSSAAAIVVTEIPSLGTLNNNLQSNPLAKFIIEILDNQIHYTGAGSIGSKIGVYISPTVGALQPSDKNIINIDDNTFIDQDYGIYFTDIDTTVLTVVLGDNSFINIGERNISQPLEGMYYELPYSNHVTNLNYANFSINSTNNVSITDDADGKILNPYYINELKAVEKDSNTIAIILKESSKIQFIVDESVVYIDNVLLTGTIADKINQINALVQGTGGGSGQLPSITSSLAVTLQQGTTLNYELTANFGVGYEWDLSSVSGITTVEGNIRKLIGGSTLAQGSYNIPVKAINYNGEDSQTLVLNVTAPAFANTKSLEFQNNDWLGGNAGILQNVLGRSGNGSGSSDAWTISLWFKRGTASNNAQTILYFGAQDVVNQGYIQLKYSGNNTVGKNLIFTYGSNNNKLTLATPTNSISANWHHILVSYDGGTTGAASGSVNQYYSRFKIFIDGVQQTTANSNSNFGYTGSIQPQNFRCGRWNQSQHMRNGCKLDELAIWDTDRSSDTSTIYNSGTPTDLSTLTNAPLHWWRMGDGDNFPFVSDVGTQANLIFQMYSMSSASFVNDVP
jgi:hypothetical protein